MEMALYVGALVVTVPLGTYPEVMWPIERMPVFFCIASMGRSGMRKHYWKTVMRLSRGWGLKGTYGRGRAGRYYAEGPGGARKDGYARVGLDDTTNRRRFDFIA